MAGTMPDNSQVPAREPINSKIKIEAIAELMLLTIPSWIACHFIPNRVVTKAATAADSIRIIWLDPSKEASPNIRTLMKRTTIKKMIGMKA